MRRSALLLALLAAVACRGRTVASAPTCADPAWRPAYTPDSSVALCLAPGYAAAGQGRRWARGTVGDSSYAWLTVAVLDSAAAADEWGVPPALPSFRRPTDPGALHATRADSVAVSRESIGGRAVEVETALVSGGQAGLRRHPALRAVWPLPGGRWALAQGFAERPAELQTLGAMLRTARLAEHARTVR
jgi:hypothetical protein